MNAKFFLKRILRMKKIIFIALTFIAETLSAQQLSLYSQYLNNMLVLNPAIAGTMSYTDVRTLIRNQWTGLDGQPKTTTVSINTGWDNKHVGLGAYVFTDKLGPVAKTGINGTYAYHFKTGPESMFSFGISGMIFLYKLATTDLKFDAAGNTDNVLLTGNFKAYNPNVGFGIYYKRKNGFAGLSVPELIPTKISSSQDFFVVQEKQHYFLMAGTRLKMSDNIDMNPSLLVKYVSGAPAQADVNLVIEYRKILSLGASYRSGAAVVLMAGFNYKEGFRFGYSYDITTSALAPFTKGSHEIMLGWIFMRKKKEESGKVPTPTDVPPPTPVK